MVAAAYANVDVELKVCQYGQENETPEFARNCSPCMRFPSMQTEEGYLFESNAIMRHIARVEKSGAKLYGATPFESSQVDMWLDFASSELDAHNMPYLMETFAGIPAAESAMATLEESLAGLELWLETRTFLVGERMTVADISVAFALQWVYRMNVKHGEELTKKYRNAYRLYNTVMQQPKTVEVLKQWGATSFVLDAYKREYSNTDTRTVAAPYFFEHYDTEGYTCFWARYKYNEDNKKQFMTANLVRGWFQRMEHVRKYAFGVALIIGEDAAHELVSFWVFRGKGMPEIVSEVVDTELFEWEEIKDVQAEKEKITDYLCWEGPTIPRPVLEGRCFK
ncbi:Elongation factor 1 gamma, conserved domain family protein [Leishmania donovani]|uniref:Elongation factor 1 gamma, conserved domain family protein n=1 Tax=Leishmania donovani TaxID=5661 RepID=A0A504X4J3_LEIDO|nr:Elongation factor 1 gamma, conserved domain family protein [Leishmania donovani]TPP41686.1 Elongation factor 1 gamma, conserved domain family protein [Leishmania donovani]TPP42838.1 Elongation factor 1 gamma, conserved domain family protein [Leishmania donovani]TPP42839.1 Elongation factor 1 gamma, conserved domain family protein [Leishmania donovani]